MKDKRLFRIIPRLDIKNGLLIKGINLEGLRILGNPLDFAEEYSKSGADEILYVDNSATLTNTNNLTKHIKNTAKKIFIPLAVGGGIRKLEDIQNVLRNGADRVYINTAAVYNPKIISEAVRIYGSSTICSNIEYIKFKNKYKICTSNGRDLVDIDPITWAKKLEKLGIGEISVTSVNHEGLKLGCDIEMIKKISQQLRIPVLAHGGIGSYNDILNLYKKTKCSGVIISSLLHYKIVQNFNIKSYKLGNYDFLKKLKKGKKTKIKNCVNKIKNFLKKNEVLVAKN